MVWYGQYYYMELNVAKMLHDLNLECEMEESQIVKKLSKVEKQASITLDEMQRKAVVEAVKNGVLVITGEDLVPVRRPRSMPLSGIFETEDMEIPSGGTYRPRSQADDGSHRLGGSDDPPASGAVWGCLLTTAAQPPLSGMKKIRWKRM